MTDSVPPAVFWCLAAVTVALAAVLVRMLLAGSVRRRRIAALESAVEARDTTLRDLVEARLPLYEARQTPPPAPRHPVLEGTSFALSLHLVEERFAGTVSRAQTRADQSAKSALKGAMRALQGLANEQQLSISEMQERHDHPEVLHDLLQIDHTNAQFGRRAQAIAVLCGSWPGRQRAASPLLDVARGATPRIRDYRRVRVHAQMDIAVVSRAVEPVVLAVAELLDNAARHSQPNTFVEVSIQPAHNGACVVIDDAGVGMDEQEVAHAVRLLDGQSGVDVNRLGDPPQFGFAVVGVLAERYGFRVSVDTRSPYGGVRAVVFLPSALLTAVEPDAPVAYRQSAEPPAAAPRHRAPAAPAAPHDAPQGTDVIGSTPAGLPKRRRREPTAGTAAAAAPQQGAAAPEQPAPGTEPGTARSVHETASRMGAFARGTRSGRAAAEQDGEGIGQQ
jgi:hypothetical protein